MEKAEFRPESPLSEEEVEHITRNWTTTEDVCHDEPQALKLVWPCDPSECKDAFGESMVVDQKRSIPEAWMNEARTYIAHLVKDYPFQLRAEMARPMWHRFIWYATETGSRQKALRHI